MNLDTKGFQQHASNTIAKIDELIPDGDLFDVLEQKYDEDLRGNTADFLANIQSVIDDLRMIAVMVTCINFDKEQQ